MNHLKTLTLLAPMALFLASPAHAQERAKSINVELGANYAMDGDVRDTTQSTGLHVGLGYQLPARATGSGRPAWTSVNLMYNRNSGHGNELTVWGLTAEERWSMASPRSVSTTTPYIGAGLGVFRVRAEADEDLPEIDAASIGSGAGVTEGDTSISETKTRIGGRIMAGVDFNRAYYIEAAYNLTGKVAGARSDSLTLSVGARF